MDRDTGKQGDIQAGRGRQADMQAWRHASSSESGRLLDRNVEGRQGDRQADMQANW